MSGCSISGGKDKALLSPNEGTAVLPGRAGQQIFASSSLLATANCHPLSTSVARHRPVTVGLASSKDILVVTSRTGSRAMIVHQHRIVRGEADHASCLSPCPFGSLRPRPVCCRPHHYTRDAYNHHSSRGQPLSSLHLSTWSLLGGSVRRAPHAHRLLPLRACCSSNEPLHRSTLSRGSLSLSSSRQPL